MYTKWTEHLKTESEKDEFRKTLRGSRQIFDRQQDILTEMEKDLDTAEINPKMYELPNWDFRQAHNNGYRQCLAILKKLTDLDQQNTKDK